jgi:hypothetical protein
MTQNLKHLGACYDFFFGEFFFKNIKIFKIQKISDQKRLLEVKKRVKVSTFVYLVFIAYPKI